MSPIEYAMPSTQSMLAYCLTGLVCTLINVSVFRAGLAKKLKLNLAAGGLGFMLSAFMALTPLLALGCRAYFHPLSALSSGLLGVVWSIYGVLCFHRAARDNRFIPALEFAIFSISFCLVLFPVLFSSVFLQTLSATAKG